MSLPQALFLDLDETLIDRPSPEVISQTCAEIAAHYPELDETRLADANREVWTAYWPEVEHSWTLGELDGAAVSLEAWRRALRKCGCTDDSVAERTARIFRQQSCAAYRLFDDAHDLVAAAEGARIPLALITNGASDTQRDKLTALDIGHWFETIVISGEVGLAKPDRRIFEVALEALAVERDAVWHIGDSLASDVTGARATGLTAVWLNRSGPARAADDPEPDIEIRSLLDLVPLLSR